MHVCNLRTTPVDKELPPPPTNIAKEKNDSNNTMSLRRPLLSAARRALHTAATASPPIRSILIANRGEIALYSPPLSPTSSWN